MIEKNFPTSIRLNAKDKEILKTLTEHYGVNESDVIKVLLRDKERELQERQNQMSSAQSKPCVISVGFPSFPEMKEGQEFLKELFNWVHGEMKGKNGPETICAGPKNGLSYNEAFAIVNHKFPESGWVYADSVGWRENDPQPRFTGRNDSLVEG
jgi:hypothetical protein